MEPLVSVVIPVLNGARYLGEAVASIVGQTYRNLEILIVDDGSTDDSALIAADYATRDSRIRVLRLERDPTLRSGARARNVAIAQAQGTYVAAMDSDDVALPERIALQLDYLERHGLDACGGQAVAFTPAESQMWFPFEQAALRRELVFRVAMLHPTVFARSAFMRAFPYDPAAAHDDYEWQVRVAFSGRLGNHPATVLRHRVHPGQSNQVFRAEFDRDLRRSRFFHTFRLYPDTTAAAYQVLNHMAEHRPLHGSTEFACAAEWLQRLADLPDSQLHARIARRWDEVCAIGEQPPEDVWCRAVRRAIDRTKD